MATYYCSPTGSGTAGTKGDPWSLDRATQAVGGAPAAGDTVRLKKGTYAQQMNIRVSGVAGSPITYLHNWDGESAGDVIFDGAWGAANGATTQPLTGWTLSNGTGILSYSAGQYASGAPAGTSGSVGYVYQRDCPGANVDTVYCDDFLATVGDTLLSPGTSNYWWVALRNMRQDTYGTNPYLRIHDYEESHDLSTDYGLSKQKHDWRGQFDVHGSTVYIRLWDSGTGGTNPNNRANPGVFIGVGATAIAITAQNYVTIDGGADDRIKLYRWKNSFNPSGCSNLTVRGVEIRWSGYAGFGINNCTNTLIDSCTVYGGGQLGLHDGRCASVGGGSSNVVFQNCTFAYGSHDGLEIRSANYITVRDCTFKFSPHGLFSRAGYTTTCTGILVERNTIYECGYVDCTPAHKVPHSGFHCGEFSNSMIRRNRFYLCGHGLVKRQTYGGSGPGTGWMNSQVYNNTIDRSEYCAMYIVDDDVGYQGRTANNIIQNNICMRSGEYAIRYCLFGNATNSGWNNLFRNNCCYTPAQSNGKDLLIWSYPDDQPGAMSPSEANNNAKGWIGPNWDANVAGNPQLAAPDTGDYAETSSSTMTINQGSEADLLQRSTDVPAVGTIDIGWYEYGGASSNAKPIAVITETAAKVVDEETGAVTIDLDGSTSTDSDGTIVAYDWDWDDGSTHGTTANPGARTYTAYRTYSVKLRVTDDDAAVSDPATYTFTVTDPGVSAGRITYDPALVTASSAVTGQGPEKVADRSIWSGHLDGGTPDPLGYWVADADKGAVYPHAVRIDLTGATSTYKRVTRVRFSPHRWQLGRSYQYRLYTSMDDIPIGSTGWTPYTDEGTSLASASADTAYEWTDTGVRAPVDARFVLVRLLSNSNGNQYGGLWEVEVYGTTPESGNPGAAYTVSLATDEDGQSAGSRWGPAKSHDGVLAGGRELFGCWWVSLIDDLGAPKSKWLNHDLGSNKQVGRVRIAFGYPSRRSYAYQLRGSQNGTSWSNLFADQASSHTSAPDEWTTETFPAANIRYVRLTVLSCEGGAIEVAKVWEMESYAT